jgi:hypothetical protein
MQRRSIPFSEALRDEVSLGKALVELGVAEPSPDGTGLHDVMINGKIERVYKIKPRRLGVQHGQDDPLYLPR